MHSVHRSLFILATFTLLVSSCQTAQTVNVDRQTVAKEVPLVSAPIKSPSQTQTGTNECLNCHSDKDRLIQTAKAEEPLEAESKGVG